MSETGILLTALIGIGVCAVWLLLTVSRQLDVLTRLYMGFRDTPYHKRRYYLLHVFTQHADPKRVNGIPRQRGEDNPD